MITFLPLGGAGEIGASCFYLNIAGSGIILDCGLHPQKTGIDALPKFDLIKNLPVDYCLITHAHQDHLSGLPYLVQRHPYVKIVATPQTRALAELTLHNSVAILKQQLGEGSELKVYSHDEVDLLIKTIDYKAYNEEFFIEGYLHKSKEPVKIKFYDAGHILGSAGILIEHKNRRIFYSGDINLDNQMIIKGALLPEEKIDVLILESTYGATDSFLFNSWHREAANLTKQINKVINNGGSILIPVFALGKLQEILVTLWKQMEKGKLTHTDLFTGGLGEKISRVYDYNRYVVRVNDPDFAIKSIPVKNLYALKRLDYFFKNPSIILASSGMMLEGTPSFKLAEKFIKQKDSAIFSVGYMEETTPGSRITEALKGEKVKLSPNSKPEEIKCIVKKFRFPAHAKREGLIEIVNKLKPEKLILIHGDTEAIDWVGSVVIKSFKKIKVYKAELGKEIQID